MTRCFRAAFLVLLPSIVGCPVPWTPPTPRAPHLEVDPISGGAFYLYVPTTYHPDRAVPVIVSCHGTPPWDIAEYHSREWKYYGQKHECIIVTPALVGTDGLFGTGSVGDMLECERRILGILSSLGHRYNIDRANMMITGFSGGGFPTYWVGMRHPDIFSVIVERNCNFNEGNLDGWWPPDAIHTPVKIYYGSNDPFTINIQSRQGVKYLRAKGFKVTTETIPGAGHERRPEKAMEFFLQNRKPPRPSAPSRRR